MKHHWHNPALQRALDVLGLHARDDGDYQLGAEALTLAQAIELVELLDAGVRLGGVNQAKAFVMGLNELEAHHLLRACLWRFRGRADVALIEVREAFLGVRALGEDLLALLVQRAIAVRAERERMGLEP